MTRTFLTAGRGVLHPRFAGVDENCLVGVPVAIPDTMVG